MPTKQLLYVAAATWPASFAKLESFSTVEGVEIA